MQVSSDVHAFGDAQPPLLVVGTVEDGFRLWCRRCDHMGKHTYGSFVDAQNAGAAARKDIAPPCRSRGRGA